MTLKGNKDGDRWGEREKEEEERRKQKKKVITEHLLPARHRASCFHMLRNPINLAPGVGNSKGSAMCQPELARLASSEGPSQILPLPRKIKGHSFPSNSLDTVSSG